MCGGDFSMPRARQKNARELKWKFPHKSEAQMNEKWLWQPPSSALMKRSPRQLFIKKLNFG